MSLKQEFKDFIMRGNVIDLAVGMVIGTAFSGIVKSLVDDVIMPPIGLLLARYVFKFHPALALGVCAGARTTTAALGAVQDAVESETPALGYTVTYAVGNTLLIIWGVVIVLLI